MSRSVSPQLIVAPVCTANCAAGSIHRLATDEDPMEAGLEPYVPLGWLVPLKHLDSDA
jgi:hypothetical protein